MNQICKTRKEDKQQHEQAGLGWAWLGLAGLGWAGLGLAGLGWAGLGFVTGKAFVTNAIFMVVIS